MIKSGGIIVSCKTGKTGEKEWWLKSVAVAVEKVRWDIPRDTDIKGRGYEGGRQSESSVIFKAELAKILKTAAGDEVYQGRKKEPRGKGCRQKWTGDAS